MKFRKGLIIGLDFDGTCVTHEYPNIGRSIGAETVLRHIIYEGGKLVLNTMRSGQQLDEAVQWFKDNDIPLFGIQRNPDQDAWTSSPKAYANLYIDDAALGCPLIYTNSDRRPFVDWQKVERLLFSNPSNLSIYEKELEKINVMLQEVLNELVGEKDCFALKTKFKNTLITFLENYCPAIKIDVDKVGLIDDTTDLLYYNEYTVNLIRNCASIKSLESHV